MRLHRQIGTAVVALTIVAGTVTAIGPDARDQLSTVLGLTQATPVAEAELPGLVEQAEAAMGKTFAQKQAEYDQAVANGVPLAESGFSEAQQADLAVLGNNVVADCAAIHSDVNLMNELLAQAPDATQIACGGYNAEAPAVYVAPVTKVPVADSTLSAAEKIAFVDAGHDLVGDCEGASGLLSNLLSNVGGDGWSCGYSSTDQK